MAKPAVTSVAQVKPLNLGRKGLKIRGCSNGSSSEKWCFIFLQALDFFLLLFRLHCPVTLSKCPKKSVSPINNCLKLYLFLFKGVAADAKKCLLTEVGGKGT
jgi:hypothetical protein